MVSPFETWALAAKQPASRLWKNSDFDFVLKGRGFSRAVTASKSIRLF